MKKLSFLILVLFPFFINAQTLNKIKKDGQINIALTESWKNTVNYKTAQEFAEFLNVKFNPVSIEWDEVFSQNGKIETDYKTNSEISYTPDALQKSDIICGTIYVLPWRKKFFDFAGIIEISDLLIINRKFSKKVKNYNDLKGLRIALLEESTYETNIKKINNQISGGIKLIKTKSEDVSKYLLKENKADGLITVSLLALS